MKDLSCEERILVRGEEVHLERPGRGWYPVLARNDRLWWRFFGEKRFSEPFFSDTLFALNQGKRLWMQSAWEGLEDFRDALAPAALIFHASRCGSTLLTQMLAALPECISMSEPPIIDSILRLHYGGGCRMKTEDLLGRAVSALGQKRFPHERHFFVKLDSWHVRSLSLFRLAFPATPFIFLYRRPEEIIASHGRQRGRQMVPGLVDAGMPPLDFVLPEDWNLEGYCHRILESFFREAARHADELIFVNYGQLPQFAWTELPELLDMALTAGQIDAMESRAGLHSKNGMKYSVDPTAGTRPPILGAFYDRLEELRLYGWLE